MAVVEGANSLEKAGSVDTPLYWEGASEMPRTVKIAALVLCRDGFVDPNKRSP
jgi:hypothetical protein